MTNSIQEFFHDNLWELIKDPCYPDGRRLYLHDKRFWVSMDENRQILFFIQDTGADKIKPLENLAGLNVSIEQIGVEHRLVCRLTSSEPELVDKFSTVAKDLAFYCSEYKGEQLFLKAQERIKSWANFLRPSRTGLSQSEFVGLLGELYVLSEHLMTVLPAADAVRAWIGPEGKKQDFTFNKCAIEVKTTLSGDQQVIRISSLDQLDKVTNDLYLLRVVAAPSGNDIGFSLGGLYERCLAAVKYDVATEGLFIHKASVLYGKASESQIRDHYAVNDVSIFKVTEGFPNLTRNNVNPAISEARYEISLGGLKDFEVANNIRGIVNNG